MADRIVVLKDGNLMQAPDSPQNMYDYPDNMFVAGFIGSPPMNFFECVLSGSESDLYIDGGTFKLRVPDILRRELTAAIGKEAVFGIRPEHLFDAGTTDGQTGGNVAEANIEVVEPLGSEVYVYLSSGPHNFQARLDARTRVKPNDTMRIGFDLNHMQLFDKASQQSLLSRQALQQANTESR